MKAKAYRRYLLVILIFGLAFNFVDRLALGLLSQSMKVDLRLSDTQLGLLGGIAFALFYSTMGVPLARWADRGDRITIITITTTVWSIAVSLCGFVTGFIQLVLMRVIVGVGEAGCIPTAHSLIADHFSRAERPRAVSIYMLGGPLSFLIGYLLTGWLNQIYGWRETFVILGLPGIPLALLAWFTLTEPRRLASAMTEATPAGQGESHASATSRPGFRSVFTHLWANITFRHLLISFSVVNFFGYGILQWQPAFFVRSYGIQTGELGTWFALIYSLGGGLGNYWGGELSSRLAPQNERLQLVSIGTAYCACGAIYAATYLVPGAYQAMGLMASAVVLSALGNGPLFATIQTLVPENMRATSVAIIYLFANFIGMGLGPLVVGVLSDFLRPVAGDECLRYALLALCPGYAWSGWHLWKASRTVTRDLEVCVEAVPRKFMETKNSAANEPG